MAWSSIDIVECIFNLSSEQELQIFLLNLYSHWDQDEGLLRQQRGHDAKIEGLYERIHWQIEAIWHFLRGDFL